MENNKSQDKIHEILVQSRDAKTNAYCPYSNFRVGAALLTEDGHIIQGCNVENASYSLGICAERCAIFKAISDGHKKFTAIAVCTDIKDYFASPCGACRQVIYEVAKEADVYMVKPDLSFKKTTAKDLLPDGFDGVCLKREQIPA